MDMEGDYTWDLQVMTNLFELKIRDNSFLESLYDINLEFCMFCSFQGVRGGPVLAKFSFFTEAFL